MGFIMVVDTRGMHLWRLNSPRGTYNLPETGIDVIQNAALVIF